ncbi:unnamed protein product, partial [Polarella glacialis]
AVELKNFTWPSPGGPTFGKPTGDFEVSTCMVCLADFIDGELLSSLPCGHSFHAACISNWLQHSRHKSKNSSNSSSNRNNNNSNNNNNRNSNNNNNHNSNNSNNSNNNSNNHSVCPCRCTTSQPLVTTGKS